MYIKLDVLKTRQIQRHIMLQRQQSRELSL